jgi:putative ABC transport system permease protein
MTLVESVRIAARSLAANKLRSSLTMLGIVIGVGAVIALVSIGRGAQQSITSQIQSMGSNLLFVSPGATNEGGVRSAQGAAQTLTLPDAQALVDPANAPAVAAVAPELRSFGQAVAQGNNVNTQVVGVTPDYQVVRNLALHDGEFLAGGSALSAVLGANVAAQLFPDGDPIGQSVRINNVPFRVMGVLEGLGGGGLGNQDDQILVPITTAQTRLGRGNFRGGNTVSQINVQVVDAGRMDEAVEEIGAILRQRHHALYEDDFTIRSQQDLLATVTGVTNVLTLFLGGIAGIALVVGGIGIMNIMLVSVTERTREIGLRKALGARRRDILLQFMTEATILSVLGGLIGILIGIGVSRLMSGLTLGTSTLHPVVSLDAIVLATVFSVAVGLFFGIYPASRAAALRPIEALRYE